MRTLLAVLLCAPAFATTYYVRPTNGNDANAGTSFAAAWQTTQKAADTAVAGDEVRLCNEATETPSARIDFDTNAASATNFIDFIGADAVDGSPLNGSGKYTLSGSSLPATTDLISVNLVGVALHFRDIRFTAATQDNIEITVSNSTYTLYERCEIDSAAVDGMYNVSTLGTHIFIECNIHSNGDEGIGVNSTGRFIGAVVGSSVHDNAGNGIELGGTGSSVVNNLIYDNGGDGIRTGSVRHHIAFNVIYGNTGDGIDFTWNNSNVSPVYMNTIVSNGGYGFNITGEDYVMSAVYNHFHNNTSGDSPSGLYGYGTVTGDPLFVSTTDGSEDFTPGTGSPLIGAGMYGNDIGAIQSAGGGGGSTVIVIED